MAAGLPLIKSLLVPLAKSDLLPLGLLSGMAAAGAAIQKKFMDQELYSVNNFNWRNKWYYENS